MSEPHPSGDLITTEVLTARNTNLGFTVPVVFPDPSELPPNGPETYEQFWKRMDKERPKPKQVPPYTSPTPPQRPKKTKKIALGKYTVGDWSHNAEVDDRGCVIFDAEMWDRDTRTRAVIAAERAAEATEKLCREVRELSRNLVASIDKLDAVVIALVPEVQNRRAKQKGDEAKQKRIEEGKARAWKLYQKSLAKNADGSGMTLDDFGFHGRVPLLFHRLKIHSVADLLRVRYDDIICTPGCGESTAVQISDLLAKKGLSLASPDAPPYEPSE